MKSSTPCGTRWYQREFMLMALLPWWWQSSLEISWCLSEQPAMRGHGMEHHRHPHCDGGNALQIFYCGEAGTVWNRQRGWTTMVPDQQNLSWMPFSPEPDASSRLDQYKGHLFSSDTSRGPPPLFHPQSGRFLSDSFICYLELKRVNNWSAHYPSETRHRVSSLKMVCRALPLSTRSSPTSLQLYSPLPHGTLGGTMISHPGTLSFPSFIFILHDKPESSPLNRRFCSSSPRFTTSFDHRVWLELNMISLELLPPAGISENISQSCCALIIV